MRSFGSDNHSGVHPLILEAIKACNYDHCKAYGDDPYTALLEKMVIQEFGSSARIFTFFNGTGANVCALRSCVQPFHAILTAETGHIAVDECGAPELHSSAALKTVPTLDGKVRVKDIEKFIHHLGFEHHSQPKVLYISQCTEYGTVYTPNEIRQLAQFLHNHDMYLHIDGARIANAAAYLKTTYAGISVDCGADILSFGATKNGLLQGEAVITFRSELAKNMKYIRKQSAQLFSKMRFHAAQLIPYFEHQIGYKNGEHANAMAQILRKEIAKIAPFEFTQPTEANIVLVKLPPKLIPELQKEHFFYVWNEATSEVRFVTSWDTTEDDIAMLVTSLKKCYQQL